jgi:hypothetical protein
MNSSNKDLYEVYVELKKETDNALLVFDGDNEVWLPKSQVLYEEPSEKSEMIMLVPEWLSIKKGLL